MVLSCHAVLIILRRRKIAQPAIFLDRDGVIIENRSDYVKSWQEVSFLPGTFYAIQKLKDAGFTIVIVTNQSVVGRGIITIDQALQINDQVIAEIEARGGRIDASYMCPHHPNDKCNCRKPAPGMLLQAKAEHDLDLLRSYLIGDATSDIEAANMVGATGILVLTGRGKGQVTLLKIKNLMSCPIVADLEEAAEYITNTRQAVTPVSVVVKPVTSFDHRGRKKR